MALTRKALNDRHSFAYDPKAGFDDKRSYYESKLANVLFAQEVADRVRDAPVFANSLHPGAVRTELWDNMMSTLPKIESTDARLLQFVQLLLEYFKPSMWTAEEGALTQVYLAAADEVRERNIRGRYFHPQALEVIPSRRFAPNRTLQKALWAFTEKLIDGEEA